MMKPASYKVWTPKQMFTCSTWPLRPLEIWSDEVASHGCHPAAHMMLKDVLGSHQALGFSFALVLGRQMYLGTALHVSLLGLGSEKSQYY